MNRLKNIWFWSGISPQDIKDNPHSFVSRALNKIDMQGGGYIAGLSEEESTFAQSLNIDKKDTKLQ